ncbi:alpha/beta fold hydrolase [Variovorax sp. GT1P44]|uniref:alpha/beta fold hydrolase n=1 Tax=Variovorax sp. GT1P44 TaxID=3443742 RepID=UPI003F47114A
MSLRQTIRFCSAPDSTPIAFARSGRGTPLVKVGNWLTHLEFDLRSPVWGHLVETLSLDHAVIRYDQRGTGLSDWEVDDISFDAWVADLEAVVEAAGVERFALLGVSQGVPVGIAYAVRHPERVTHLVLHGGYARGRLRRGGDAAQRELAETNIKLAELGWGRDEASFRQFFTSQFIPDGTLEQLRWFNELQRVSTSPVNAARMMRTLYDIDVGAMLARIECPTLVLHATGDLSVPFAEGRLLAGGIQQARFVPLATANHLMLAQDAEWPRWVAEVRDFLTTAGDTAALQPFANLTSRERELVELIAQGRDNAQIAALLGLSDKTVRNHVSNIFTKLEVENRPQAIVLARNAGFGARG